MKFILGKKVNMTQIFKEDGTVVPVTKINVGPCYVVQIKTKDKEGYDAVQIGFEEAKESRLTKPAFGHLKKIQKPLKHLREFRITNTEVYKLGDVITVSTFNQGERVKVSGLSKGKGFQGVVKRHGFHGSPASHGHKDQLRMPGSIGATTPQRTIAGRKMGGHMGFKTITVKNLEIAKIDVEKGALYLKGAAPGARGTLLAIKTHS